MSVQQPYVGTLDPGAITWSITTLCQTGMRLLLMPFLMPFPGTAPSPSERRRVEQVRMDVWQLRAAWDQVSQTNAISAVSAELRTLLPSSDDIARAIKVWTGAVETIMFEIQRQHGTDASGPLKKERAMAVLMHFLSELRLHIPEIPKVVEPFVFEIAADWTIELVYDLVQRNGLWPQLTSSPQRERRVAVRVWGWLTRLIARWFDRYSGATWRLVLRSYPITPRLQAAVVQLAAETRAASTDVPAHLAELVRWVSSHRVQVQALLNVISVAASQAEVLLFEKTGEEKKAYVRDLVLVFLADYGLIKLDGGIGYLLASHVVSWLIDTVVNMFNKRDRFQHRSARALPPAHPVAAASTEGRR